MTVRKTKKDLTTLNLGFENLFGRFAQSKPGEAADVIARELSEQLKDANDRIKAAREDIKRGARSGKERFRI